MARLKLDRRAAHCRRVYLHHFPDGYRDETYVAWERDYKVAAHTAWQEQLGRDRFDELVGVLGSDEYD